jgi:hypothetical protein
LTPRKETLRLPVRTPAYVDRAIGAAELNISPETWDNWVDQGILPKAAPGFPTSTPRWRWADVDRKLAGIASANDAGRFVEKAGLLNGAPKRGARKRETA